MLLNSVFLLAGSCHLLSQYSKILESDLILVITVLSVYFPIISKVFESLINSYITHSLESLNLLSEHQYGFRSDRFTADPLTVVFERIYLFLDACGETRAIALDLSKAFDRE